MPYDEGYCKIGNLLVHPATAKGITPFQVVQESGTEDDLGDWEEVLEFGTNGLGGSLPVVRNQHHYSNLVDLSEYGYLGPGPLQSQVGLALDSPVTSMMAMRDGAQVDGPRFVTAAANDASIGTVAWTNPTNIFASDNVYATVTLGVGAVSNYLKATGAAFTALGIPSHATIVGVTVKVEEATPGARSHTINCRLVVGGAIVGSTKTITGLSSGADTERTFGGAADSWGVDLSGADVVSNFGVVISFTNDSGFSETFRVDGVTITLDFLASNVYLYGIGGTVSTKIRLSAIGAGAAFGVVETKTFTAVCTHAIALKDTGAPGGAIPDRFSQPGSTMALFGFGGAAGLQQIDAIGYNTNDTYRSGAHDAYGGVFGLAQGPTNLSTVVWKSTGFASQSSGAFSRIQSVAVPSASTDLTNDGAWGSLYAIGEAGSSVTWFTEHENGLRVGKPEGVFGFNTKYVPNTIFGTRNYKNGDNGRGMTAWGETLMIPTVRDLMAQPPMGADALVGLRTLVANQSDIQGQPTFTIAFGDSLFVVFYDGTDSYLVEMRRRRPYESIPHPLVVLPVVKVASYRINCLFITDDGLGEHYLFYDRPSATANKYDIGYFTLTPASERRYATGGVLETGLFGSPRHKTQLEELVFDAEDCTATDYWDVAIAWDKGDGTGLGAYETIGRINAAGRNIITLEPESDAAWGYTGRLRYTCTVSASANRPRLRGASIRTGQEIGVILSGQRQKEEVDAFVLTLLVGQGMITTGGGRDLSHPAHHYTALAELRDGVHPFYYEHWFGDSTPRHVLIKQVGFTMGPQDGPAPPQQYLQVKGRLLVQQVN